MGDAVKCYFLFNVVLTEHEEEKDATRNISTYSVTCVPICENIDSQSILENQA